ncbi:MAG: siphovirus ReqiPepy6 Gp37-like family protein, partial [Clostridium sp.]
LEVYNTKLEFIGIIDNFISLVWNRKYYKSGDFSIKMLLNQTNIDLLQRDYILYKSDNEAVYIDHRSISLDNSGEEILEVKGKSLTSFLDRRIIWDQTVYEGTIEELLRHLVDKNCITTKSERIIPKLNLASAKGYTEYIKWQNTGGNLLEEIEKICETHGYGFRINFIYETMALEFEVFKGLDRTEGQQLNDKALFSRQYENILEQDYIELLGDYKNTCLVAGAGEGIARKKYAIESGVGLSRYELYVDARDLSDKEQKTRVVTDPSTGEQKEEQYEVEIPAAIYNQMLLERGQQKLNECKEIITFDATVNIAQDQENLVYKRDFNLGDIVTIFDDEWQIELNTRITEIQEIYENSGPAINVIFGSNIPSVYEKLKRR